MRLFSRAAAAWSAASNGLQRSRTAMSSTVKISVATVTAISGARLRGAVPRCSSLVADSDMAGHSARRGAVHAWFRLGRGSGEVQEPGQHDRGDQG